MSRHVNSYMRMTRLVPRARLMCNFDLLDSCEEIDSAPVSCRVRHDSISARGAGVPRALRLAHDDHPARSHARSHLYPFSRRRRERAVPFHSGGKMRTSRSPGGTRYLARLAGSALGLVFAATTAAAQTGVVAGTVTEASSGRGHQAVRIQIVGNENAAASTDANGHFLIRNAPSGAQTVRATQIGYRPESKPITVGSDTVRVAFQLSQSAVELQQVVVTGTGGAVEKRQVGASIGEVDATKLQEQMVIPDVGRMLSSKVTGL